MKHTGKSLITALALLCIFNAGAKETRVPDASIVKMIIQ